MNEKYDLDYYYYYLFFINEGELGLKIWIRIMEENDLHFFQNLIRFDMMWNEVGNWLFASVFC